MAHLYGAEHVRRYRETDGEEGHYWRRGAPTLLLTTTGRRSGGQHTTPLIYQPDGDRYVVVASKGGADTPPDWYLNLEEDPDVEVQVWGDRFAARARPATDEEQSRLWPVMTAVWPDYDAYQRKTERPIPLVILERAA